MVQRSVRRYVVGYYTLLRHRAFPRPYPVCSPCLVHIRDPEAQAASVQVENTVATTDGRQSQV